MTQRDKVKELVGRGLHSYHTKSLQQMDRIEKKNKEQNHKISILSNELDNDYLTKTEEGSVISLEHSKEGMVYLDELQGNTLVNYCTDGSKELTLNGDIDVEGTFVTTTEGTDNGKVDVMCEGNTLVNISNTSIYGINKAISETNLVVTRDTNYLKATTNGEIYDNNSWVYADFGKPKLTLLKPNTKYTVIGERIKGIATMAICDGSTANALAPFTVVKDNRALLTTNDLGAGIGGQILYGYIKNNEDQKVIDIEVKNLIILEGDWTNKQIPSEYFEGMKSVGQDDTNGHKIEILSQNKNLFRKELVQQGNLSGGSSDLGSEITHPSQYKRTDFIKIKPNTTYSVSMNGDIFRLEKKMLYDENKKCISNISGNTFNSGSAKYLRVVFEKTINTEIETDEVLMNHNIQIEEGNVRTDYKIGVLNKKEILLNEPLRELPNGVKDKFVKIGGKYYVERNCGEIMLNGDEVWNYWNLNTGLNNDYISFYMSFNGKNYEPNVSYDLISDILVNVDNTLWYRDLTSNSVALNADINISLQIGVKKSDLQTQDVVGFKQWLKTNKPKIVYKLKTPFYEPLEIEPTLNTYSDTTHISNNSIIPCNMKIKNSGYNAIIKPSTLYTVALDTNKNGTIGMNLGGVKGTTTNNVATITTPATLTDDSLRLYGKGIKGSKVRLLEGDKTNWIPSYFEGMKSSFEDKLQDDGSYKMEILSNSKNLFDFSMDNLYNNNPNYSPKQTNEGILIGSMYHTPMWLKNGFWIQKGQKYTISILGKRNIDDYDAIYFGNKDMEYGQDLYPLNFGWANWNTTEFKWYKKTVIANETCFIEKWIMHGSDIDLDAYTIKQVMIEKSEAPTDYVEYKSNKIQFSSIEPLRGVGDVKDRFVFKDGKLMVERNCSSVTFDGSDNEGWFLTSNPSTNTTRFRINVVPKCYGSLSGYCDKFKVLANTDKIDMESIFLGDAFTVRILNSKLQTQDVAGFKQWLLENPTTVTYQLAEPTYEEVPFELQKIIFEGYENGTLFFDTNIPPTSTVTYAGETPIVKSIKLNKTEVLNNTNDINDNIIPYLMDMDYRVVCLQLQSEEFNGGIAMARLFGGAYEMLQRDIQSKRYSVDEYRHRLDAYLSANKITEEEYNKLGDMLNE